MKSEKDLNGSFSGEVTFRPNADGILVPPIPVSHRDDEYDPRGFDLLWEMQSCHFWYRGRHRFILRALRAELRRLGPPDQKQLAVVDLGGGCGGWLKYLTERMPGRFSELALADSSLVALRYARKLLGHTAAYYHVDLLNLMWHERWDVAFLLDVLEHIAEDKAALGQAARSIRPGGLIFVTAPALKFFWSYNDEVAHHVRRYSKSDFGRLAKAAGLRLATARYFMFLLSPLLWLSRFRPGLAKMSDSQRVEVAARAHRIPARPFNVLLGLIFAAETPLGHWLKFPWGTSILGVFQKPR